MGSVVSEHPNLGPCLTDHLYSYAVGHMTEVEEPHQDWLVEHLFYNDWSFTSLVRTIALSESFRSHGSLSEETETSTDTEEDVEEAPS